MRSVISATFISNWKTRFASAILICFLLQCSHVTAQTCGNPGTDGPVTIRGIVNTYYPGVGTASAGGTTVTLGADNASGASTPIKIGDLVLIIQVQDEGINYINGTAYGSDNGNGGTASNFEFGLAANAISMSGGTLTLTAGLKYTYTTAAATASQGKKTFQLLRVPQYSSATLSSATAPSWNGATGGIVAIDVAGNLNLAGGVINVNGMGFRGAGGVQMNGGSGTAGDYLLTSGKGGGSKGEGIAGTPRYTFDGSTTVTDNVTEGYPGGSYNRGAPGNAGGGGSDGNPPNNDQNSGGGGGGNGGAGGVGGNTWSSTLPYGGIGGYATASAMGGGGGAGTSNDTVGYRVSGGAGGGGVILRAGSVTGSGTINANGSIGQTADQDGGGGGGAGGSVVVFVKTGLLSGLTINVNGGKGGDTWLSQPLGTNGINRHGPGGGGGGGVVLQSGGATVYTTQGAHGVSTAGSDAYGSIDGSAGYSAGATLATFSGTSSGAQCFPILTVTNSTTTASIAQGSTATYKITVKNAVGLGTANSVTLADVLPTPVTNGFTYKANVTIALAGGALRAPINDPTVASIIPNWGVFTIPAGAEVDITFTVSVAGNVPVATYQNPATATYLDPARTTTTGTTFASYNPASSTAEDVSVTAVAVLAVSGFVFTDTNHDGSIDPGETWTGATVYVNLVMSGAVVKSTTVAAGTGSFTLSPVASGSYTLVLTTSAILTTGTVPAGWMLTSPSTPSQAVIVGTTSALNQNFGLFQGGRITGKVFQDSGTGGGIANDGKLNGGELGISTIAMTATNGAATTYDSTNTDGTGNYTLWIPSAAASVSITETKTPGYLSTGAEVGNTAGIYTRLSDTIVFTNAAGTTYSGVNFGDVAPNTFNPNNAQSGLPGNVLIYAHTFKAQTGGQVVFSTSAVASPARNNFAEVIYRDVNCNGTFDAGDPQVTAAVTVNVGDTICLIVKEMISVAAPLSSTNSISVSAQFTYTNSNPVLAAASYLDSDVTTVGNPTSAGLRLLKAVDKITAKSGDVLSYSITYFNDSSGALSNVFINDATPSYTTFLTATCVLPLPTNLTGCTISVPAVGAQGSIRWTAVGTLAPSTSGQVTFTVKIQ